MIVIRGAVLSGGAHDHGARRTTSLKLSNYTHSIKGEKMAAVKTGTKKIGEK